MDDEPRLREADPNDPHSSFRLEITLSVGYRRRRALATRWEGPIISVLLCVGGIAVVLLFLFWVSQLKL